MKASIGRIVHYVGVGSDSCQAAIISAVDNVGDTVTLTVFAPAGTRTLLTIHYHEEHRASSWHWPERVED